MPTVNDKSGIEFETLSQELRASCLSDDNITAKEHHPMVWKVGNKLVTVGQIEDLYELAMLRKKQFEDKMIERARRKGVK